MAQIHELIPKVMHDIGAIGKGRKNQAQNYAFRGIDDMYNAVQPSLVRHGVFVCPSVIAQAREERQTKSGTNLIYTVLTVKHTVYAPDGSSVEVVTVGEAMDSGDKSANKAMSAAMKYALIELFSIPTEEDNDTENHTHEVAARRAPATAAATPPATPEQVATLTGLLAQTKTDNAAALRRAQVKAWADLTAAKAENIIDKLSAKLVEQQKQPAAA